MMVKPENVDVAGTISRGTKKSEQQTATIRDQFYRGSCWESGIGNPRQS